MIKRIIRSSLFRSSGIYTIASIISASIPFLLIPILTRKLSPIDYGIVSMATILVSIVTPFIGVSAQGAINRRYFDGEQNNFPRYVGNCFILLVISSLVFFIIFLLFNNLISSHTAVPGIWLYAILFTAISQFISLILLTIWQAKVEAFKYGLLQVIQSCLNFGLTLYFIFILNYGWEGRILGQMLAVFFIAILAIIILIKNKFVVFQYNREDIKDALNFGLPLIPHTLGGLLIAFTDRFLITNMIGINETGVYTVAYQIGSVIGLINASFINAYVPWLYAKLNLNNNKVKVQIVKFTYLYFAILILGAFLSVFLLPWFIGFFAGKSYKAASLYTFWILLGYVFNGMYLMIAGFIFYVKKTSVLSKITLITALCNIPICYVFILYYGTLGAAISMSVIYAITFICTWIFSNRVFKMPWLTFLRPI